MIVALTTIALVLTFFLLPGANRGWKMSSYVWGLLGYPSVVAVTETRSGDDAQEHGTSIPQGQTNRLNGLKEQSPNSPGGKDGEITPKAKPTIVRTLPPVPVFSLQSADTVRDVQLDCEEEDDEDNLPPPSFPALNSAQRTSVMPPPQVPTLKPLQNASPAPSRGLMPPPSIPSIRGAPSISPAASLRIPSSGPLPNRGPSSNTLATPVTTATKTPNPRQKVQLKPGHSPLDWASLKRSGKNLSGVDRLVRVTPSLLKQYNGRKGQPAWSSYQGRVYNVTPYLPYHPGGEGELRRVAGKDGGKLFNEVHPWVNWENMLEGCLVGIMVSEGDGNSGLDDMD